MRRALIYAATAIGGAAVLAALVVASGVVPVKASSGHWRVTRAILSFAMERSVATHTLGGEPLALGNEWLVVKGAGHYHTACLPCHGSPDRAYFPGIVRGMTPPPPYLPPRIREWDPDELFYIVKHGVKFTGMPAFPSQQRDDEVQAIVAFLLALPELGPDEYERLAHGEARPRGIEAAPPDPLGSDPAFGRLVAGCARCHGADGLGRGAGAFPKLAGQHREYLANALEAYARGERHSGIMQPIAAGLDPDVRRRLAAHYARLPPEGGASTAAAADAAAIARGEEIVRRGIPERGVPSCRDCHGPTEAPHNPAYPGLPGQYAAYVVLQLELFKQHRRGGSPFAHLMDQVAPRLTAEEMRDVAAYYASRPFGTGH